MRPTLLSVFAACVVALMPVRGDAGMPFEPETDAARAAWAEYQLANLPRAFAVGPNGAFAWRSDSDGTDDAVAANALDACAQTTQTQTTQGATCRIIASGLGPAPDGSTATAPEPALAEGPGWAFLADPRFHWHGPDGAAGALVWTHGTGPPSNIYTGQQPPAWTRAFNLAGWDVIRFDRFPASTAGTFDGAARIARRAASAENYREGMDRLRAAGYRHTVATGFSAGAWLMLHALNRPGFADAAIIVSAVSHGPWPGERRARQIPELEALADAANAPDLRLAVVQFEDDPFLEQPARRAEIFRNRFGPHLGAVLMIDRPAGFVTHGAEDNPDFAPRFGGCLLRFATGGAC